MLGNILAVGLMSMGMGLSGVKDEPQMYAQNAETYTITYETADDWNEKALAIHNYLKENNHTDLASMMQVTGTIKLSDDVNETVSGIYTSASDEAGWQYITIKGSNSYNYANDETPPTWYTSTHSNRSFIEITITSQEFYEAMAEPEPSMGSDIIGTIASGLGIIGALASNFLVGFGALFYANGALTPFAIFALVMLGVAVSFAVVKLVLNLIRSNTGA